MPMAYFLFPFLQNDSGGEKSPSLLYIQKGEMRKLETRDAPRLKGVIRLDSIPLSKAYFTPEGFLRDKPIVTSCGIFEYSENDGTIRRELRLPEEVFSPESLESYVGKPVIVTHNAGLIDKDNVADNQIGTILSKGEKDGMDVRAEIIIHNTDEMKSAGFKELSLGYNLDLDETPGVWKGQHYDAVQRNIRINHLALVREARAGDQARLNLDGRDTNALKGGKVMGARKIRKTHHGDAVLSQEEFEKAIDEYKKRKAQREGTQTDEDDTEEEMPVKEPTVEDKVAEVKERRDRRDEEGDPKDEEEALTTIARQDEDLDILFDIIDTLLAKTDYDDADAESDKPVTEELPEDEEEDAEEVGGIDDMEKLQKNTASDEDDVPEDEDDEFSEDADDEEIPEDEEDPDTEEDEDDVPEDEEEEELDIEEDEDDVPEDDEESDEEMDGEDCDDESCGKKSNMDSMDARISRGIREHMMLGNIGRKVGINGLEYRSTRAAKKAIIHAVQPGMRLDGKSDTYINAAFKYAKADIKARNKKDTNYQKKQMFNKDSRDTVRKDSAMSARERMIARQHNK